MTNLISYSTSLDGYEDGHVINAGLGNNAVSVTNKVNDNHAEPNIRCRDGILETLHSEDGFIGRYIDNKKTALK